MFAVRKAVMGGARPVPEIIAGLTGTGGPNITIPAECEVGELIIVMLEYSGITSATAATSSTPGVVKEYGYTDGGIGAAMFSKKIIAGDAGSTLNLSYGSVSGRRWVLYRFRSAEVDKVSATATGTLASGLTMDSLDAAGGLLIVACRSNTSGIVFSDPSGMSLLTRQNSSTPTLTLFKQEIERGATGTKTSTTGSGGTAAVRGHAFTLKGK